MAEMTDQVVLVTGAAGNVGRALAVLLAGQGVRVAALDRAGTALLDGVADPAPHLPLAGVDLLDPAACTAAIAQVIARYGRLDGVAHTVGGFAMAPLAESGAEFFDRMLRINLISTVNLYQAAVAAMRPAGRGSLVAIGALAGQKAPAGMAAYAAAKGAVLRLTESLADELKSTGIRVNAVLPSTIDTPQNRASMPDADPAPWVKPEEVAAAMAFLLSAAAAGVPGALLPVTGRV